MYWAAAARVFAAPYSSVAALVCRTAVGRVARRTREYRWASEFPRHMVVVSVYTLAAGWDTVVVSVYMMAADRDMVVVAAYTLVVGWDTMVLAEWEKMVAQEPFPDSSTGRHN